MIGARLKELLRIKGVTVSELSERMGYKSYSIMSNVIKGNTNINLEHLLRLHSVFPDMNFNYLLNNVGEVLLEDSVVRVDKPLDDSRLNCRPKNEGNAYLNHRYVLGKGNNKIKYDNCVRCGHPRPLDLDV